MSLISVIFADDKAENFTGTFVPECDFVKVNSYNRLSQDAKGIWTEYSNRINLWSEIASIIQEETGEENFELVEKYKAFLLKNLGIKCKFVDPVDLESGITTEQLDGITANILSKQDSYKETLVFMDWDNTITYSCGFLNDWNSVKDTIYRKVFNGIDRDISDRIIIKTFAIYYYGGRDRYNFLKKWWNETNSICKLSILTTNIKYKSIYDFMVDTGLESSLEQVKHSNTKMFTIRYLQIQEEKKYTDSILQQSTLVRTESIVRTHSPPVQVR